MKKQDLINELNEKDNFKAHGFEVAADDGENQLLTKKYGNGIMQINRFRDSDGFYEYSDDVSGWNIE